MTSESFRRDVAEKIDGIIKSRDPHESVDFPTCLSAEERKYIHHIAEQFGLRHDSQGKGDARYITVRRDPAKLERRCFTSAGSLPRLELPKEAWEALKHPVVQHASNNLEALEQGAPLFAVTSEECSRLLGYAAAPGSLTRSSSVGAAAEAATGASVRGPLDTPLLEARRALPAWSTREDVVKTVAQNQVTIIVGETGSGKSTQVPQFILEEDLAANMVVTQPRKISALALAHRVSHERGEETGQTAGYSVHLENVSSSSTRLLFCTTGVFRRRMLSDPTLAGITHLVLDELHERDKVADFMLIAVKDLAAIRPDLRVILMSATMQHEVFESYFPGCAKVCIVGRTYPVEEYFLEDIAPVLHAKGYHQELGPGFAAGGLGYGSWNDKGSEKSFKYQVLVGRPHDPDGLCGYGANARLALTGQRLNEGLFLHDVLQQTKGVAYDLPIVEALLLALLPKEEEQSGTDNRRRGARPHEVPELPGRKDGGVLVFLPGWDEIDRLKRRLRAHPVLGDRRKFWILPLHSQIRLEQQREVFKAPPKGTRKIVLSTNLAETSLTINDISVVLDCGRAKEVSYDACLCVPTLNTSWVSCASMTQRAGRAGRTSPGVCYHLFSTRRADRLDQHRPAEILRSALDDIYLHAKLLLTLNGQAEVSAGSFLRRAPEPPQPRSVESAERLLQDIGALTGSSEDEVGQLTALGVHLSAMPLQAQLAKTIIWASIFGVGDDALDVVSGLQYREPFVTIGDAQQALSLAEANRAVRRAKKALCSPHHSDHLALLRASRLFEEACAGGSEAAKDFCEQNSLSFKQMHTLRQTRGKLRRELQGRGFWHDAVTSRNRDDAVLLSAAICAGLFPNVAYDSGGGKMKAGGGRMEALPHPSSVFSDKVAKGRGKGKQVAVDPSVVDEFGVESKPQSGQWMCFNELTQVEDHYSLVGLSPVPAVALLLLCGEGALDIRDANAPGGGSTADDANVPSAAASSSAPHTSPGMDSEDVLLSIPELGDWLVVRARRETGQHLQALRGMLRMLFRKYCNDPGGWCAAVEAGQAASVVLDIASRLIRGETAGPTAFTAVASRAETHVPQNRRATGGRGQRESGSQSGAHSAVVTANRAQRSSSGYSAASGAASHRQSASGHSQASGAYSNQQSISGHFAARAADSYYQSGGREANPSQRKPATSWPCGFCGRLASEAQGRYGTFNGVWYCTPCWSTF